MVISIYNLLITLEFRPNVIYQFFSRNIWYKAFLLQLMFNLITHLKSVLVYITKIASVQLIYFFVTKWLVVLLICCSLSYTRRQTSFTRIATFRNYVVWDHCQRTAYMFPAQTLVLCCRGVQRSILLTRI